MPKLFTRRWRLYLTFDDTIGRYKCLERFAQSVPTTWLRKRPLASADPSMILRFRTAWTEEFCKVDVVKKTEAKELNALLSNIIAI